MLEQQVQAVTDSVEACADALLTAAGAVLLMSGEDHVNVHAARAIALTAIDNVIERTINEGAKPR